MNLLLSIFCLKMNISLRNGNKHLDKENGKKVQEKYLHTLGNLTLTGYNSEYKDKFFIEKQEMKGGFKASPLHLNEGLRHIKNLGRKMKLKSEQNN